LLVMLLFILNGDGGAFREVVVGRRVPPPRPFLFQSKVEELLFVASGYYVYAAALYDFLNKDKLIQNHGFVFSVANSVSGSELVGWLVGKAHGVAKELCAPQMITETMNVTATFDLSTQQQSMKSLGLSVIANLEITVSQHSIAQQAGLQHRDIIRCVDRVDVSTWTSRQVENAIADKLEMPTRSLAIEAVRTSTRPSNESPPWIFCLNEQAEIICRVLMDGGHLYRKGSPFFSADSSRYQFTHTLATTGGIFANSSHADDDERDDFVVPVLKDSAIAPRHTKRDLILGVLRLHKSDTAARFLRQMTSIIAATHE